MRFAFIDPVTSRLISHGYAETNRPGDVRLDVADDFALDPRDGWRWDGAAWVAFPFPPIPATRLRLALDSLLDDAAEATLLRPKVRAILSAMREVTP